MKRLLKISFDLFIFSLVPVLTWFVLSILVNKNLINIFSLTYPIQFIWYILTSIFSTGANICKEKNKNNNAVISGFIIGAIFGAIIFGFLTLNADKYIEFMNMDVNTYLYFTKYSFILLYIQLLLAFILNKLYYEGKNTLANLYSFSFNLINFFTIITSILITKNIVISIYITLIILALFITIIILKSVNKFEFNFNLLDSIKYDSVDLFNNIAFFFIFLFGLSNAFNFGEQYITAITFISLITDAQWDAFDAVAVSAKIDISRKDFNYIEHKKNAYKLLVILLSFVCIMFIAFYNFYNLNLGITLIFLSFELINFFIFPIYRLKTCYLQLEYSAVITTANKVFSNILRMFLSLIKTPYCTGIAQVTTSLYEFFSINIIFNKNFKFDKNGNIIKKHI